MIENNKYTIQNNIVLINGTQISFDFPIKESLEISSMLIVYLDLSDKVIPLEQNVFGISLIEKKIKWQVEKRNYPKGGYSKMKCPFVGISFIEDKLRLHNWCSTNLIVDPVTGKVLEEEETR